MSSFICQESEILLVKNRKQFNEMLELALIKEEEHDFYMVYYFFYYKTVNLILFSYIYIILM
jgi:hypothetical protein